MLLSREDAELVFKLHCALMQFVMEQVQGADVAAPAAAYRTLSTEQRQKVAQAFLGRLDLIEAFIATNPAGLSEEELGIVSSWRHLVSGRFIALRQLKKYMVLLACDEKSTAYGVTGLVEPMELVIPMPLPAMIETVLLPFRGKIVYDGIISAFKVTFGPGSRRGFEEDFRTAKANHGIVVSLPCEGPANKPSLDARKPRPIRAPQQREASVKEVLNHVVGMTRCLLPGAPQRGIQGVVPETGREAGWQEALTPAPRRAPNLGVRRPSHHRLGEFFGRSFPIVAHEAPGDRPGIGRGGEHRSRKSQSHPADAQDSPIRSPLDSPKSLGK